MTRGAAIDVEDLSFAYRGATRPNLDHIDLSIAPGELVLLTGVSGCGKSTLALAMAGMIPSQVEGEVRGRVHCQGHPIGPVPVREASRFVGLVFQNPNLQLFHQRVESELAFGPENLCLPGPEIGSRVAHALEATGIGALRMSTIATLSGGQKQRTSIAATLAMGPGVLVLDEPLSDLDPVGCQEVLGTLRLLASDDGVAIVLIEHRVDEVLGFCDRVVLMDDGAIVLDAPVAEAFDDLSPWRDTGVGVPDMIRLSRALPSVFAGGPEALTPGQAAAALAGTAFTDRLRAALRGPDPSRPAIGGAPAALSWESVEVGFGGRPVLDGLTLSLQTGSWTALVGANGSGKTTLIHTAVGLQAPDRGRVSVLGRAVDTRRVGAQSGRVALLLQAADEMLFGRTVAEELRFGDTHRRAAPGSPRLALDAIAQAFGFDELGELSPWQLSQGGRQRLALAAQLVGAPAVLILDEPTTGQDNEHRGAFMALLDAVRERTDMTLLMVTHDMRSVASRAERLIVLGDGTPQLDGTPRAVFARGAELARWGVLSPPTARLQCELIGDDARWVALDVEELLSVIASAAPALEGRAA